MRETLMHKNIEIRELAPAELAHVQGGTRLLVVGAFWAAWEGGEKIGRTLHDAFCDEVHSKA